MDTSTYDAHLGLITDLLSPGELPRSALASIAHHLAILEDGPLAHLIVTILTSHSLWQGNALYTEGGESSSSTATEKRAANQAVFERSRDACIAVQQGVVEKAKLLERASGTGWRARRAFSRSIEAILGSVESSSGETAYPYAQFAVSNAVLQAVQYLEFQKNQLVVKSKALRHRAVAVAVASWARVMPSDTDPTRYLTYEDLDMVPAWLAAQTLAEVPSEALQPLATENILDYLFSFLRASLDDGLLLTGLDDDLQQTEQGLLWSSECLSFQAIKARSSSTAYAQLGRVSRMLGKVIESRSDARFLHLLNARLHTLEQLAANVHRTWATCRWSQISGPEDLHPSTSEAQLPWEYMKTVLFTLTMVHSSLISLLNTIPLSAGQVPSNTVLASAACALRTFSHVYFITSKFGTDGFGAYRSVWYGALDLVVRAGEARVEQTAREIEPSRTIAGERAQERVQRSSVTYYLNAMEQLVGAVSDAYVQDTLLPIAQPYLESKEYIETFEAAHSVLLAVFAKRKLIAVRLAPWYSEYLVNAYPALLSLPQLRLAYTTMTACMAEQDETVAWSCLSRLFDKLGEIPVVPALTQLPVGGEQPHSPGAPEAAESKQPETQIGEREKGKEVDELLRDEHDPQSASEIEAAVLTSSRGPLLLTLIDQAAAVNLSLLIPLLDRILWCIGEEAGETPVRARSALAKALHQTLASAMDMTKRETAAKYWLEHRQYIQETLQAEIL